GLFESDLLAHGVKQTQNGGLIDCSGNQFWVFDVDGTHQAARQRALAEAPCYPEVHRRTQTATAKGYMGRRRGETTRTRSRGDPGAYQCEQLQQVAEFIAFLKFRDKRRRTILDPTRLVSLTTEFVEEDRMLAEAGMDDYAAMLAQEDQK
ncbi:MAG: hypothetical protein MJA27_20590, partial [Pseudanabaenales cyanobacterium]|nr:hypothetical protein [Pseudanabaenales cyanobacterium]